MTHTLHPHTLADLTARAWTDNPRRHDLEAISASLVRFGYVDPLVVDDTSGHLLSGHGALASLLIAQEDGLPRPARVTALPDGEWQVDVVHVALAPGEARAYTVAEVRTRELGGWHDEKLIAVLQQIQETPLGLEGTGFAPSELEALMAKVGGELPDSFKELAPDAPPQSVTGSKAVTCPHCGQSFMP